jgi:hypothetical protein
VLSTWVKLPRAETVLEEIGAGRGHRPLVPRTRELLADTTAKPLTMQNQLRAINIDLDLREPGDEEVQETREFLFRNV